MIWLCAHTANLHTLSGQEEGETKRQKKTKEDKKKTKKRQKKEKSTLQTCRPLWTGGGRGNLRENKLADSNAPTTVHSYHHHHHH